MLRKIIKIIVIVVITTLLFLLYSFYMNGTKKNPELNPFKEHSIDETDIGDV